MATSKLPSKSNDSIKGTAGNDSIDALAGADSISGLAGNDWLNGNLGNDSIDGGNGDDTLIGFDGNDTLLAGSGNDSLTGDKGNDLLDGGVGNDTLDGGVGKDTLKGGEGNDVYYVNDKADSIIESTAKGTGGNDTVFSTSYTYALDVAGLVENLTLVNLAGGTPTGVVNTGTGNKANNVITGNIADNLLLGLDGNDTLNGGDGADTLDGGAGKDVLNGGEGDDVYYMNNNEDSIKDSGGDFDQIVAQGVSFDISTSDFIEVLTLSTKTLKGKVVDGLTGTGNEVNNLIQEIADGATNNTLIGAAGDDTLDGSGGDDELQGDAGNDSLIGGEGDDTAVYNGDSSDYVVKQDADAEGAYTVEYIGSEPDSDEGLDELVGIEHITFSDMTIDSINITEEGGNASSFGDENSTETEIGDGEEEVDGVVDEVAEEALLIIGVSTTDYSFA
jgi:Ca2+-binding RTX toxin-like protein